MAETTTYQCPNCSGKLSFDSSLGKLRCEFCDSTFTPAEVEQLYAEKQAKADAKAAGDRAQEAAEETGAHARPSQQLSEQQLAELAAQRQRVIDEGIAAGKSADEINAEIAELNQRMLGMQGGAAAQAAAVAAGQAAAPAVSAAEASTTDATRVKPTHSAMTGDPVQDYLAQAERVSASDEDLRAFNCNACGAQLMVDQVTAVTSCPYCGNNAVVPGQLSDVLKPDYVIPFKYDKDAAVAALKQYYNGKKFLPDSFTDGNHIEEIQGVYVPFWLYTGNARGDVTFNGRNMRTWSDSENIYTETDHYLLHRVGTMDFDLVPVDGSSKMPDAHMDAIEPFDYSEMVPFSMAYLPGYITDRYDQDVKQCDHRARKRVENTCIDTIQEAASGYMEIDVAHSDSGVDWTNIAYALLPVWMLHTRWDDNDYLFAMNGQTGKLIGDLPIDHGKVRRRALVLFLPFALILAAVIYFVFGF